MRIAYLSTFYPFRGGIAQFNASLYREMEKEHEIKAFTFTRQYPNILFPGSSQYVTEGDRADKIPSVACLDTVNPITYLTAAAKIKSFSPDLMLMKFWMPFFGPSLGTVAKSVRKKTKIITVLDNVIPHEKRIGDMALIRYFLNQNHAFIVMSKTVKKDLLYFLPNAHYVFHEHPLYNHFGERVDTAVARKKLGIPDGKKIILFFGFIRDYKGLDLLIDSMTKLDSSYHLVIAGEVYGDFKKYQEQIDQQNLKEKTTVHARYISDDEVPLFFSASDVCVLPYKSATQSGITAVSFHFEVPMIATDVGGLKEIIHHGETGLIVAKPDAGMIAESIHQYFEPANRTIFKENIHKMKERLSWYSLAKTIEQLYYKIV